MSFSMLVMVCFLFITAETFFSNAVHLFLASLAENWPRLRRRIGAEVDTGPERERIFSFCRMY